MIDFTSQARREKGWVIALLLLAFLVRGIPALVPHFWYDEVFTIGMIQQSFKAILNLTAQDAHPPLYYYWVKCVAAAGRRLGGPFATLAWLRQASILPGMLTCLLGWWVARRHWGVRRALWVLALLAVSPALVYYSVELRNYSTSHCLLLAGMIGLLGALDPRARRPAAWTAVFTCAMLMALYTHTLCALYLGAMGAIALAEIALRRGERRRLLGRAVAGGVPVVLGYLPWVPVVLAQSGRLNQLDLTWLTWAGWRDLGTTFCWYLPLGFFNPDFSRLTWPWVVIGAIGLALAALVAAALGRAVQFWRRSGRPGDLAPLPSARLLAYALVLAVLPILTAFFLSHAHLTKVFLGNRYNLMASPFFTLALAGLIFGLRRRWLRLGVLAACLGIGAACGAGSLWQRVQTLNSIEWIANTAAAPGTITSQSSLYWLNTVGLPWLERCGAYRMKSYQDAFAADAREGAAPRDCFFLLHGVLIDSFPFSTSESIMVEKLLVRRGAKALDVSRLWDWPGVWQMSSRDLPGLAAEWRSRMDAIEKRRRSIPGGQVILSDEPIFREAGGWSSLSLNAELMPERWTEGPRQRLAWAGPPVPGRYRLAVRFWRSHPFPEKEITVRYRLPGAVKWSELKAGLGAVTLEGDVTVRSGSEVLTLDMETPPWIPAERLPGSVDHRPLGMTFMEIDLRPLANVR